MHAEYGIFVYTIWPLFLLAAHAPRAGAIAARDREEERPRPVLVARAAHLKLNLLTCGVRAQTCRHTQMLLLLLLLPVQSHMNTVFAAQ
jgi:hypothetical protein